jgi:hypothetical protein
MPESPLGMLRITDNSHYSYQLLIRLPASRSCTAPDTISEAEADPLLTLREGERGRGREGQEMTSDREGGGRARS